MCVYLSDSAVMGFAVSISTDTRDGCLASRPRSVPLRPAGTGLTAKLTRSRQGHSPIAVNDSFTELGPSQEAASGTAASDAHLMSDLRPQRTPLLMGPLISLISSPHLGVCHRCALWTGSNSILSSRQNVETLALEVKLAPRGRSVTD
jgi:hypothetical protein